MAKHARMVGTFALEFISSTSSWSSTRLSLCICLFPGTSRSLLLKRKSIEKRRKENARYTLFSLSRENATEYSCIRCIRIPTYMSCSLNIQLILSERFSKCRITCRSARSNKWPDFSTKAFRPVFQEDGASAAPFSRLSRRLAGRSVDGRRGRLITMYRCKIV